MKKQRIVWRGLRNSLGYTSSIVAISIGLLCELQAAPPPSGLAPLQVPSGGFAIDGDLLSGSPGAALGDWLAGPNGGGGVLGATGDPLDVSTTFHFIDPYGNSGADMIFSGGLKWTDNPNSWSWSSGKPSSKTEINNVLLHIGTDAESHVWTVVSADRASTSGESYIDFEFLQNPLTRTASGNFVSGGPHGGRTTNDLLLSLAFVEGGKVADFFAYRWLPVAGGYAYVDVTTNLPVGRVFVGLNANRIAVPYGAFGLNTYDPNAFAEAAVDLTALLSSFDPCRSFGFKTIMVKTKASSSSTASIEDFIDPIQYNLQIGPSADAGADQTRCWEGETTAFALQGKATSGLYPVQSTTWSVVSGTAVVESPNLLATTVRVGSGSATLRLTVQEANGCISTDDVNLYVSPLPVPTISGPTTACPDSLITFEAPTGMSAYAWTVSGNAAVSGASDKASLTVRAGKGCDLPFTVELAVISNKCSGAVSLSAMVVDATAPTLVVPPNIELACPSETSTNLTGTAIAGDDCGQVALSFSDSVTNICGGAKVVSRTWTARDLCGNSTSLTQIITVSDTAKPTLILPADITLECPAEPGTNVTGTATARDACSSVVIGFTDAVTPGCGNAKEIARTWTAVDACGNASSGVQKISVKDTTRPILTIPPDLTLQCPADTGTNATGVALATDTCGSAAVSFSDLVITNCGGTEVISRTWVAADECGNTSTAVQKITVQDTLQPTLIVPPDLTLDCPADTSTNSTGVAMASDLCGSVTIRYMDATTNGCSGSSTISRTWTATDACGNASVGVQTIVVRDVTRPTLVVPPNLVLECPADTSTNATGRAIAEDACSEAAITFTDSVTNGCGNTQVITRRWMATDGCGNSVEGAQTITVRDTTQPSLILPADLVLECPADVSTNATGIARGEDACGSVRITYQDAVTNGCGGAKFIARAWTATDECGNSRSGIQTIKVQDTTKPTLVVPPDLVLECPADIRTNATGMATAQDACGTVNIVFSDSTTNLCGGTKVVTRTWTATDTCGNAESGRQTITVRDTVAPSLIVPADLVLECPGDTRTNVTGVPVVGDACGSVTINYSDVVSNSCGLTRTVRRLWTITDACGNTTNGLQTITVRDTTKPTITCKPITVQCPGDVPAAYLTLESFLAAGGTASDKCSALLVFSLVSDTGLVGSCPGTVTRVYRVTDDCGNYADCTQTITVKDTIAPTIICPPAVTLECTGSAEPEFTGVATAVDNCDSDPVITYTNRVVPSQYSIKWYASDPNREHAPYLPTYLKVRPGSLPCPEEARLTGRAADPLRNAVAYGPAFSQLDALTSLGAEPMALGQIVPFQAVIEVSGGSTRPENGTIEFSSSWSTHTTSNDEFGYDRAYMVYCAFVDVAEAGYLDPNENAKVESYRSALAGAGTVDEKIVGTFRVSGLETGDRVVVEIWVVLSSVQPRNFGGTIASDLVSAQKMLAIPETISTGAQTVSIGNLSKIGPIPTGQGEQPPLPPIHPQPDPLPGGLVTVIDRTWTATDDCGNRASCVQRFTVRDNIPPVIVVPADISLEFPAETGTNVTGVATAVDLCGQTSVSFVDSVTNTCGAAQVILRQWTAVDEWGNSTNAFQVITIGDTTAPVLAAPLDLILECPAEAGTDAAGFATATDASGISNISYADVVTEICGDARIIHRTWTAIDACGNTGSALQRITIQDTTPPIMLTPADVELSGPAQTDPEITGFATATDASGACEVSFADSLVQRPDGSRTITRTWTAIDLCGNSVSATQIITVLAPAPLIPPAIIDGPLCQVVGYGDDITLTVTGTGSGPLAFQWQFNGADIPGATQTSLRLDNIQFSNAGLYTVKISNSAGSITSPPAIIDVLPRLIGTRSGSDLVLTWPDGFILQSAPTPLGPYADVPGAVSPHVQTTTTGIQRYFRLRAAPFSLNATLLLSGQTRINITGAPGVNFMLQASTDLIHWATISTNTAPTSLYIYDTAVSASRYFRVVPLQVGENESVELPPVIDAQPVSQTSALGSDVQLSVRASGTGPLFYQWQKEGVDVPGSGPDLVLRNVQFADAGVYSVMVISPGGVTTSDSVIINVLPMVSMVGGTGAWQLEWPQPYVLQSAAAVTGPYADVIGATSPYAMETSAAAQGFFRLRAPQPRVTCSFISGGGQQISIAGTAGINYVIQSTADFVTWTDLGIRTAPGTITDFTGGGSMRFYRAIPAK